MAERNPPLHLQAGSHPANNDRRFLEQLTGLRPGIFKAGDFAVTQTGTPSMAVLVAAGAAIVDGTEASDQGVYFVDSDGNDTLAIAAADATNARFDMIVARVRDAAYSGATNAWALEVVQGTPAASPVEPAIPANCLVLARVSVAAGASSIVNANIVDRRTTTTGQGRVASLGGVVVCTSTTRPSGAALYEGLTIYETDTDKMWVWDGSTWNLPKNVPGGILGYAEITSSQNGFAGVSDVSGLSVTVTVGAGRRVKVTGYGRVNQQSTIAIPELRIWEGSTQLQLASSTVRAGEVAMLNPEVILTPSAGSHTYKLRLGTTSGTVDFFATSEQKGFILVEDIGSA